MPDETTQQPNIPESSPPGTQLEPVTIVSESNGSTTSSDPENAGNSRNPDGTFKTGFSGNPAGKTPGTISITAAIKKRLGEIYTDPDMPLSEKKTHLEALVDAVMHNALKNRDQKALKDIWNYIDGLPKGTMDIGVDREGLAELTAFMRGLANPEDK